MIDLKEIIDLLKEKLEEAINRKDFVFDKIRKMDEEMSKIDDDGKTLYYEYHDENQFLHDEIDAMGTALYAIENYDSRRWEKLMTFGEALELLKKGRKIARKGWNGKGLWLEIQNPDGGSKMTLPYVYLNYPSGDKYHDGCKVPWLPSQTDMLEQDWVEVE